MLLRNFDWFKMRTSRLSRKLITLDIRIRKEKKRELKENTSLKKDYNRKIQELISRHEKVFAKNKFDVGTVKNHEARIKLVIEKYTAKKPYRCSLPDQREIDTQIK